MQKRSTARARVSAAAALIAAFVVLIVVIASSLGGGSDEATSRRHEPARVEKPSQPTQRFYVVQDGDTLTAIARRTGVPVARLEELNPGIDPQILVSGQRLKLR